MTEKMPYDVAREDFGFPRFARDFPRDPELDRLVVAFTRGDYATVRTGAPKLAAETKDEAVANAARTLGERIQADPTAKLLFAATAALLAFLTLWWIAHDGPPPGSTKEPKTIEYVK